MNFCEKLGLIEGVIDKAGEYSMKGADGYPCVIKAFTLKGSDTIYNAVSGTPAVALLSPGDTVSFEPEDYSGAYGLKLVRGLRKIEKKLGYYKL